MQHRLFRQQQIRSIGIEKKDKRTSTGVRFLVMTKEFMKSMVNTKFIDYTGIIKRSEG